MNKNLIPEFVKGKNIKLPTDTEIQILQNIRKCKKITDFLTLKTHGNTTAVYGGIIRDYFIKLNIKNPNNYLKDPRIMQNKKKVEYLDTIEKDTLKFNKSLQDKSGSYRKTSLSTIRQLLETNKIELGNSFWKDIRKNGKKAFRQTDTKTPSPEQLKNILSRADTEAKAFFLTQMTSGSRVKEILLLTDDMLNLNDDPPSIRILAENTKNGKPITKFITPEAKYHLQQYLKNREKILETRINRGKNKKTKEDYKNRIFPMSQSNIQTVWNNLTDKEGLYDVDEKTKKPKMGTHSLRRYCEDNLKNPKLSKYLQGKLSTSEEPYQYKTENKLDDEYRKDMHNLYIFEETEETKTDLKNAQQKIEELNKKLRDTDNFYQTKYKNIEDQLEQLNDTIKYHINPEPDSPYQYPGYPTYHNGYDIQNGKIIDYKWDEKQKKRIRVTQSEQIEIDRYRQEIKDPILDLAKIIQKTKKENPNLSEDEIYQIAEKIWHTETKK